MSRLKNLKKALNYLSLICLITVILAIVASFMYTTKNDDAFIVMIVFFSIAGATGLASIILHFIRLYLKQKDQENNQQIHLEKLPSLQLKSNPEEHLHQADDLGESPYASPRTYPVMEMESQNTQNTPLQKLQTSLLPEEKFVVELVDEDKMPNEKIVEIEDFN